ncbi:MAG TPA: hypothetical protein VFF76_00340 [Holophagaceae bacterium]|jgi:hypothetical protein|nr:hypothetical protein [Holophagaceae bacterium]
MSPTLLVRTSHIIHIRSGGTLVKIHHAQSPYCTGDWFAYGAQWFKVQTWTGDGSAPALFIDLLQPLLG